MDIAYNRGISTVIVLDNSITGMTGHQNNPANGYTISGDPTAAVDLEALAHALGIRRVTVVDPYDIEGMPPGGGNRAAGGGALPDHRPTSLRPPQIA